MILPPPPDVHTHVHMVRSPLLLVVVLGAVVVPHICSSSKASTVAMVVTNPAQKRSINHPSKCIRNIHSRNPTTFRNLKFRVKVIDLKPLDVQY